MKSFTAKRMANLKAIKTALLNYAEIVNENDCASTTEIAMILTAVDHIKEAIEALEFIEVINDVHNL